MAIFFILLLLFYLFPVMVTVLLVIEIGYFQAKDRFPSVRNLRLVYVLALIANLLMIFFLPRVLGCFDVEKVYMIHFGAILFILLPFRWFIIVYNYRLEKRREGSPPNEPQES